MSTQAIAAIDPATLKPDQRVVLSKLLEGAAKDIVKGLKDDKLKLKQGSHPGAISLRIEGEVVVDAPGSTTSVDLSLEEIVAVAIGPKKVAEWVAQHAKKIKAARKNKAKSEEIAEGAKAVKQLVKDEATKSGMTSTKGKAGATRCDPRLLIGEIKVA